MRPTAAPGESGPPGPPLRPGRGVLGVLIVGLVLGVAAQGARGLYRPDEGRYTAIAVRMLQTGDWIHPELQHEQPHYSKPPLTYWAIAASLAIVGRHEFGARLPNAIAFLLTLLVLHAAAKRLLPRRPWLPVVLYAFCAFPRVAQNIVTTDTWLALFTATTACGFLAWRFDAQRPRRFLLLMWLGLGLGFLTKGPPALIPLLGIVLFTVWQDGPRALRALGSWTGLLLFLVLGFGWYAAVAASEAGLATYFLRDEVQARIFSGSHKRNADALYILTRYVPLLLFGCFPWVLQTWRGVGAAAKALRDPAAATSRYLLCWLATAVVVFFAAGSRLPLYLLQVFPALILLAALHAPETLLRTRRSALWLGLFVLVGTVALTAARWVPMESDTRPLAAAIREQVPFAPKEVLFFRKPHMALSLYLDCEVEQVGLQPMAGDAGHEWHGLAEEMTEDEADRLFCVEPYMEADFQAVAQDAGLHFEAVGRTKAYIFYAPTQDLIGLPRAPK